LNLAGASAPRQSEGDWDHAGNHHVAVRRLQEPQLHDDEKQEEALRAHGDKEVLQFMPEAYVT
jgi:hypothetical protein